MSVVLPPPPNTKLSKPQTAYFVSEDSILPFQVTHSCPKDSWYTTRIAVIFEKPLWKNFPDAKPLQGKFQIDVSPSILGNPFEHDLVAWDIQDAVDILEDLYRDLPDSWDFSQILTEVQAAAAGKETYISPFTGKRV